jgi:hypothetical protein
VGAGVARERREVCHGTPHVGQKSTTDRRPPQMRGMRHVACCVLFVLNFLCCRSILARPLLLLPLSPRRPSVAAARCSPSASPPRPPRASPPQCTVCPTTDRLFSLLFFPHSQRAKAGVGQSVGFAAGGGTAGAGLGGGRAGRATSQPRLARAAQPRLSCPPHAAPPARSPGRQSRRHPRRKRRKRNKEKERKLFCHVVLC